MKSKMVFTRLKDNDAELLKNAALNMRDMTQARLIRVIILDWLEKFRPENNLK